MTGFRYPITAIAVVGLGALVALAVGVSLYLGLSSAAENTRRLVAQRSGTLVNDLDRRITSQLQTVVQRSRWAVEQIESGDVTMEDSQALNTVMRFMLGTTPHLAEVAITDPRALSRRWTRTSAQPTVEELVRSPEITAWLDARASEIGPRWRAPSWSASLGATVLRLDMPIRIDGTFAGVLSQAVTISDLSQHIASVGADPGVVPFILYGRRPGPGPSTADLPGARTSPIATMPSSTSTRSGMRCSNASGLPAIASCPCSAA